MLGRRSRRPSTRRPVLDRSGDTEEPLRIILGYLCQPLRGHQHALAIPSVRGIYAQVTDDPGLVVYEEILYVAKLPVFRLQGVTHDGGRRPEARLSTLPRVGTDGWIEHPRLRIHIHAHFELRLGLGDSKGTRVCGPALHGLRRYEAPPIWKPVPGIDYEIANSP